MTNRDPILLLHKIRQKLIKKYQPSCIQKTVDFVECAGEEHPDYELWHELSFSGNIHNIQAKSANITQLIFHFLSEFKARISDKKLELILWRAGPFLSKEEDGKYKLVARWAQK